MISTSEDHVIGVDYHPTSASYFRLNNQKLMLTYKSHLNKSDFKSWILKTTKIKCKFIELAHEIGTRNDSPYPHTHVLIDFGKPFSTRSSRRLDYTNIHPNIKKITSISHWNNALTYLSKEDPDNSHLHSVTPSITDRVWSFDTLQEALSSCVKRPSDAHGIKTIFDAKPKNPININIPSFSWQKDLMTRLESPADNRSIIWYYDPIGNTGKSYLCKYLVNYFPEHYYVARQVGNSYHFSTVISNALSSRWTGHCLFLDIPRSTDITSIYSSIEEVKDGVITSLKYNGATTIFDNSHVVILSNFLPDTEKMSADRWRIYELYRQDTDVFASPYHNYTD